MLPCLFIEIGQVSVQHFSCYCSVWFMTCFIFFSSFVSTNFSSLSINLMGFSWQLHFNSIFEFSLWSSYSSTSSTLITVDSYSSLFTWLMETLGQALFLLYLQVLSLNRFTLSLIITIFYWLLFRFNNLPFVEILRYQSHFTFLLFRKQSISS